MIELEKFENLAVGTSLLLATSWLVLSGVSGLYVDEETGCRVICQKSVRDRASLNTRTQLRYLHNTAYLQLISTSYVDLCRQNRMEQDKRIARHFFNEKVWQICIVKVSIYARIRSRQSTRFTYPRGMERWVDLVDLIIAPRPGVELATFRSRVRRSTNATTK